MVWKEWDFSQLPEIRARLRAVEEPFLTFLGTYKEQGIAGVDLVAMRQTLSLESFRSYMEASRELIRIDRAEKKLAGAAQEPGAVIVAPQAEDVQN
jgi:hypothetical protein